MGPYCKLLAKRLIFFSSINICFCHNAADMLKLAFVEKVKKKNKIISSFYSPFYFNYLFIFIFCLFMFYLILIKKL